MKKNLMFKIGASLLAIFLMTACNSEDTDTDQEQPDTEQTDQTETEDGAEEDTE
ncbi:hypothetical protein RGU12_11480 [Fredinandcohnia sp. QZ13]|uniref:hypothetical protein n=1 Tax=Fredinandcohnia sp. QZ13 TaxID=3073144 RepID=UPI00285363BF|nr:hypothetical protein [Fredinandcohnia sp. QZ13]MDR4888172.1 hypothetical protein [Fredinandcohnia sp. QZ13]